MDNKIVNDCLLSIIVTCYNEEKYISRCLESILNQKHEKIEIIVIDDFSKDNSIEIINKYYNKIRLYAFNKNHGLSYARNFGIKHSFGNYLMFMDGDDYLADGILCYIIHQLVHSKPDILFGLIKPFKEHSNVVSRWKEPYVDNPNIFCNISNGDKLLLIRDLKFKMPPAQRYIVRKEFIKQNNLSFESICHEDELWTPKILCLAQNIEFLCKTFFYHMITEDGLGGRLNELDIESYIYICHKLLNFSKQLNDEKKAQFIVSRCNYSMKKINIRLQEWDKKRQKKFLKKNQRKLVKIINQLV